MISRLRRKIKIYKRLVRERGLIRDLDDEESNLVGEIKDRNLTYLSKSKLANIVYAINRLRRKNVKGIYIEAGCALGGSTILISKKKDVETEFYVFDVFGMIPPPSEEDTSDVHDRYRTIVEGKSRGLGGDLYYGYQKNLYQTVKSNLESFDIQLDEENVELIKGKVQDTMDIGEPVAFAHIDVDWYEPVKTCLEQIWPRLEKGGVIILDDYHDWGGCRKAADEYFREIDDPFTMDDQYGSMRVTKG